MDYSEQAALVTCWWCGAQPLELHEVTTLSGVPYRLIPQWPGGDHAHAELPPTPTQLEQAGHEALMRIRRAASDVDTA